MTLSELAIRFFRGVSLLKTSYPAGTLAFPANAGYLLRHANDSLIRDDLAVLHLGGGVAVLEWFGVRFELTLSVLLVLVFTLKTMNLVAATVSQDVHLAEIRDLLLKQHQE